MGKWIEKQDLKKENKERDKVRKEKLAGYFLNLSQLTFVALVLGGVTPLYADDGAKLDLFIIVTGAILTLMFASVGSRILK
jgi:hypothetical protein